MTSMIPLFVGRDASVELNSIAAMPMETVEGGAPGEPEMIGQKEAILNAPNRLFLKERG